MSGNRLVLLECEFAPTYDAMGLQQTNTFLLWNYMTRMLILSGTIYH